ncbi:MAG: hypothetical protein ACR2PO_10700 [Methyloligellaceae bacterium]
MEFLWLVIGLIIGIVIAWFVLNARCNRQLAEREAELSGAKRQVEQALEQAGSAHEVTQTRLAEVEAREAEAEKQISSLGADLDAASKELESVKADAVEKGAVISEVQSESDDLKARLVAADEGHSDLEAQLNDARAARDAAGDDSRARIEGLEADLRERDGEISRLQAELADLRAASEAQAEAAAIEPEPTQETDSEPAPLFTAEAGGSSDDLTKIKGIGRVLNDKLHKLGVTTFRQIADFTDDDIARVDEELDFPGRIKREKWVEQAKAIVGGDAG